MNTFDHELVQGPIPRSVWKLAWPAVLLNLVNGVHGLVDHILVGNFVGYEGNAGVGMAWQVFLVLVVCITSLFHGTNVLVSRYAGRRDREHMSEVAYHSFLASLYFLVFLVAPVGYLVAPYLLQIVHATPGEIVHALPYLRILFLLSAPLFLMMLLTFAMQASGNPKIPLVLGTLATVLNVVFSLILVTGAGPAPKMGTAGAALATCLAPAVSVSIALWLIYRRKIILHPPVRYTLVPNLNVLKAVIRIGLPTGVQAVALNIGGVLLMRYIGYLEDSAAVRAAYTICYTQLFSFVAWPSWGLRNAASTLMGQNIGFGNPDRGVRGVYVAASFGAAWAVGMGILYRVCPEILLAAFGQHGGPVVDYGVNLLSYLSYSGVFLTMALAVTGGLIGAGDTMAPMLIALFTQFVVLLGACQLFASMGMLSAQTIWIAILASHITRLPLTLAAFHGGKWRRIHVEIEG